MGRKIMAAMLLLLMLLPLLLAQDLDAFRIKYGQQFQDRMDSWLISPTGGPGPALLALLICIFANGLVYMAGWMLQSEHLKRYAKSEFLQVSASAMMILFAVTLLYTVSTGGGDNVSAIQLMGDILGTGSTIDCAAIQGGKFYIWRIQDANFGSGPLGAFKCKVQEKINALERQYNNVVEANMATERAESVCINLFGVPVYCGTWDLSLHNQVEKNHMISAKIVGLLMPLHAQFVLAQYLQNNMLQVFLPMGLVLRIFPFTRGVGGLFIAIAIGFFFLWPTFFLLTDPTFVKVDARQTETQQGMCFTGFKGASVLLAGVFANTAVSSASDLATGNAQQLLYQITIGTLFYPFVALVITLIFIRAVTPLLGGDLGELMKMVARLG